MVDKTLTVIVDGDFTGFIGFIGGLKAAKKEAKALRKELKNQSSFSLAFDVDDRPAERAFWIAEVKRERLSASGAFGV